MEEEKIYSLIIDGDEVSWKSVLLKTIKQNNMNPWDIDVSRLSNLFLDKIKQLSELNLRISGKVILAAALLLKLKSKRLIEDDVNHLNSIIESYDSSLGEQYDDFEPFDFFSEDTANFDEFNTEDNVTSVPQSVDRDTFVVQPRSPLPRKRKVSIFDLVSALQKALEVKNRKVLRSIETNEIKVPEKKIDIGRLIDVLFEKLKRLLSNKSQITFKELIPEDHTKKDVALTILPLLHLDRAGKIYIEQKVPFGEITITFPKRDMSLQ